MSSCVNFETLCLFQPYLRASRKALCASLFSSSVHTALFPTFSWAGKLAPSYFSLRRVFLLPLAFVRPKFRNFVYVSACFPSFLFAAVLCFLSPCTVLALVTSGRKQERNVLSPLFGWDPSVPSLPAFPNHFVLGMSE